MATTRLITPWEVVMYSPAGNNYQRGGLQEYIDIVEEELAESFLGWDYYELMLSAAESYDGLIGWNVATTYNTGDRALYFDTPIESLQNSNTVEPCVDDGTNWQVLPKFINNTIYENLWKRYLRRYLALRVLSDSLNHTTYQIGQKGVVIEEGDRTGTKTADHKAFIGSKHSLEADAQRTLDRAQSYMKRTGNYSDTLVMSSLSCDNENGYQRAYNANRFIFRNRQKNDSFEW